MKKALFFQSFKEKKVRCLLCHHQCLIPEGKRGLCGVRENQKGILYSLVYGKIIAENVDPIEKKPLYHFLPGTLSYSIATVGCNFRCSFCQNADISQASKEGYFFHKKEIPGKKCTAEEIVREALHFNCQSIAYTYTEPTIFFEFALEVMKLAHQNGLKNVWVTNGYTSPEALKMAAPYLDAANVDLKFFKEDLYLKICGAKLFPILENLKLYKKLGIWLEVTTLIIPGKNDDQGQLKKIAQFIAQELGKETPWHISRFFPMYKMTDISPTPVETIHQAYQIGKRAGLKYIYGGNIPGDSTENTFCPKCQTLNIKRYGYSLKRFDQKGKCFKCGENLNILL